MSTPSPFIEDEDEQQKPQKLADPEVTPNVGLWSNGGHDDFSQDMGPAYVALKGIGSAVNKGGAVLSGIEKQLYGGMGDVAESVGIPSKGLRYLEQGAAANEQEAWDTARDLMPDASTTGVGMQVIHGAVEGGSLMLAGAAVGGPMAAAATVGGVEGPAKTHELMAQGVDENTASVAGVVTGITSGFGAIVPAAYGSTLLMRVASGAASNTILGAASRYADHTILEENGYQAMADQQKVLDETQIWADIALGATFGVLHHLTAAEPADWDAVMHRMRSPDNRDAALVVNLALADRRASSGVPADAAAANAHAAAQEQTLRTFTAGRPTDLTESGVEGQKFLPRPPADITPASEVVLDHLKDAGHMPPDATVHDMETRLVDQATPAEAPPRNESPIAEVENEPIPQEAIDAHAERVAAAEKPLAPPEETPTFDVDKVFRKSSVYRKGDPAVDSLLQFIARDGGMNRNEASSRGVDPASWEDPTTRVGHMRAFSKQSKKTADQIAISAHAAGYPVADAYGNPNPHALMDAIQQELSGKKVFSQANQRYMEEMLKEREWHTQQALQDEHNAKYMTLYHGSRHVFDKMDAQHVGEGEGAQSYGHGLYLAENEDVGKSYMKAGAAHQEATLQEKVAYYKPGLVLKDLGKGPVDTVKSYDPETNYLTVDRTGDRYHQIGEKGVRETSYAPHHDRSVIRKALGLPAIDPGNLYKLAVKHEDVARMLDWDEHLSTQPPALRDQLIKMIEALPEDVREPLDNEINGEYGDMTGREVYDTFKRAATEDLLPGQTGTSGDDGRQDASDYLLRNGIPGIRYRDQFSRGPGRPNEPTRNMVIFDDSLARIMERNGEPLTPLEHHALDIAHVEATHMPVDMHLVEKDFSALMELSHLSEEDRENAAVRFENAETDDERVTIVQELRDRANETIQESGGDGGPVVPRRGAFEAEPGSTAPEHAGSKPPVPAEADRDAGGDDEHGRPDSSVTTSRVNAALDDHPGMLIPLDGRMVDAKSALDQAAADTATASEEIPKATKAVIDCFLGRGE